MKLIWLNFGRRSYAAGHYTIQERIYVRGHWTPFVTVKRHRVVEDLRELVALQCANGNWNYDPYTHGLANGLILALTVVTGEEPRFLDAPAEWLADRKHEVEPVAVAP